MASTSASVSSSLLSTGKVSFQRVFRPSISTSATAKDLQLLHTQPEIAAGALVEFKRDQKAGLALLQSPDGSKNWKAVDLRYILLWRFLLHKWAVFASVSIRDNSLNHHYGHLLEYLSSFN